MLPFRLSAAEGQNSAKLYSKRRGLFGGKCGVYNLTDGPERDKVHDTGVPGRCLQRMGPKVYKSFKLFMI